MPLPASEATLKLSKVISTKWLATLPRTIAVSGVGVALLAAQIARLESKCVSMRSRIKIKEAQTECKATTGEELR